jgi:hypothetical protein
MGEGSGSMGSGNSVQTSNAQDVNLSQGFNFAGPIVNNPFASGPSTNWLLPLAALGIVLFMAVKK